jgi:hypothetical protein
MATATGRLIQLRGSDIPVIYPNSWPHRSTNQTLQFDHGVRICEPSVERGARVVGGLSYDLLQLEEGRATELVLVPGHRYTLQT